MHPRFGCSSPESSSFALCPSLDPIPAPVAAEMGDSDVGPLKLKSQKNVRVGFGFGRSSGGEKLLVYLALYGIDPVKMILFSGDQEEGSSG